MTADNFIKSILRKTESPSIRESCNYALDLGGSDVKKYQNLISALIAVILVMTGIRNRGVQN